MIQKHRALSQANFRMQQNRDLQMYTIDDLSTMLKNGSAIDIMQQFCR